MTAYTRDSPIRGFGTVSAEAIQAWFVSRGPAYKGFAPDGQYQAPPDGLGQAIVDECRRYPEQPVNHDLLAGQILHETAAWQSEYARERNNPGGIGAINSNPDQALWFETPQEGVRAHVAHMLNYVYGRGVWSKDDPRGLPDGYYGVVDVLWHLEQRWAWTPPAKYAATPVDQRYGAQLAKHANALVSFANDGSWDMAAQIPGFKWVAADSEHFTQGRGGKRIVGGAQHYSAGTNSLAWLSTTSGRNPYDPEAMVSAHFLIHTNPAMENRGYQMVRIEDTAYTTGGIVNPITVSIEKEHLASQTLDDMDYAVMGQTWADIEAYVRKHGLGDFSQGIKGHNTWVNQPSRICPDGIDVARVVREWQQRRGGTPPSPTPTPPGDPLDPNPSVPDPRASENPYGRFWIPTDIAMQMRADEQQCGFITIGYVVSGAFVEDDKLVVYTERRRYERHRDRRIYLGLVGLESYMDGQE
jgi:hypothetical protein